MSKAFEFYMGDNFNRSYREGIDDWCCSNVITLSNSYTAVDGVLNCMENKFEKLEDAIKALSKQMENIKFSGKDIGAALKKVGNKLSNGGCRSLRSELKTLGGNGRYV